MHLRKCLFLRRWSQKILPHFTCTTSKNLSFHTSLLQKKSLSFQKIYKKDNSLIRQMRKKNSYPGFRYNYTPLAWSILRQILLYVNLFLIIFRWRLFLIIFPIQYLRWFLYRSSSHASYNKILNKWLKILAT
jgi:hypothetical protein